MVVSFAAAQQCNIHPPANLFVTDITACSATLHWSSYGGAQEYKVRYKLTTSTVWSSSVAVGLDTFWTFDGLQAGKDYQLAVRSFCADGTKSALIRKTITTATCTLPESTSTEVISDNSAKIILETACPADTIYYRYGLTSQPLILHTAIGSDNVMLTDLQNNLSYTYQVSTCPLKQHNWTPSQSFIFHAPKPNILLILLDDSRFDFYSCNGAPDFFQTPAIDRIAQEGVNFKNNFAVYSLCAPSRACIATGMYSSRTGVISNSTQSSLNPNLALLPQILHDNGYYTALLGKNHDIFNDSSGYFDYWFESVSNTDGDSLKEFSYNGTDQLLPGFITDLLTDSTVKLIQQTTQPFFIWMALRDTHDPAIPKPENDELYADDTMPLKADTAAFNVNYPSFLYQLANRNYSVGQDAVDLYQKTYEVMHNVDSSVSLLLKALEDAGKLDNTMIIFTSDNGHLFGEHHLFMKRLAYDPSIRTPLFIRYPKWFPSSSKVTAQFTLNIDLPPTIITAAGISNAYNMDGISLDRIFNRQVTRKEMYYHSFYTTENQYEKLPFTKAIRDLKYKYIYYGCSGATTEEFFDLVNDPLEMNNLVNYAQYSSLIQQYRDKLPAYTLQYADTTSETMLPNCYLKNPQQTEKEVMNELQTGFVLYPNPSDEYVTVYFFPMISAQLEIADLTGRSLYHFDIAEGTGQLTLPKLPPGFYSAILFHNGEKRVKKFIIE